MTPYLLGALGLVGGGLAAAILGWRMSVANDARKVAESALTAMTLDRDNFIVRLNNEHEQHLASTARYETIIAGLHAEIDKLVLGLSNDPAAVKKRLEDLFGGTL